MVARCTSLGDHSYCACAGARGTGVSSASPRRDVEQDVSTIEQLPDTVGAQNQLAVVETLKRSRKRLARLHG
ncbi:hypothetical protein MRX96_022700 [Rhipicephalus microplus]